MEKTLSGRTLARIRRGAPDCTFHKREIDSLSAFLELVELSAGTKAFWFRGHSNFRYTLSPSALRYGTPSAIDRAVDTIKEFQRLSEYKLPRPPHESDHLGWWQIAQHYGLPTRLLDWTQSPAVALYFSCRSSESDGVVFMMNPNDLNRLANPRRKTLTLSRGEIKDEIDRYAGLRANRRLKYPKIMAISPTWNSERIIVQQGVFTVHGTIAEIDQKICPSLVGIVIPKIHKSTIMRQLERIGLSEMFLFPELEHLCSDLKRKI